MFEYLRAELADYAEKEIENNSKRICNPEKENMVVYYSTDRRLEQYVNGDITREQLNDFAIKRMTKQVQKDYKKHIEKLDVVQEAGDLDKILINIRYNKAHNARAEIDVFTDVGYDHYSGRASGYGYDKGSSALASALNE